MQLPIKCSMHVHTIYPLHCFLILANKTKLGDIKINVFLFSTYHLKLLYSTALQMAKHDHISLLHTVGFLCFKINYIFGVI